MNSNHNTVAENIHIKMLQLYKIQYAPKKNVCRQRLEQNK